MAQIITLGRRLLQWYAAQLHQRPLVTQMLTNGPLWGIGDVISQCLTSQNLEWDRARVHMTFGFFFAGPICHLWYTNLDRMVSRWIVQKTRWKFIATKVLIDQFGFEPIYLPFYFACTAALEGRFSIKSWRKKLEDEFGTTFLADCMVWIIVQTLNFRYVPVIAQALVVNVVSVGWTAFLSYQTHKPPKNKIS